LLWVHAPKAVNRE